MVWQVVFSVVMRNQRCRGKPANSKVASYGGKKKQKPKTHKCYLFFFWWKYSQVWEGDFKTVKDKKLERNDISFFGFFFVLMFVSLKSLQCKFSFFMGISFTLRHVNLREKEWEMGQKLQYCLSWALCQVWQLAGQCRFPVCHCFSLLHSQVSQEQNTCQAHVPRSDNQ